MDKGLDKLNQLYQWLQDRALFETRAWYKNPDGKYSGHIHAKLGSTTWHFHTGSGWSEPELSWEPSNNWRRRRRLVWYGKVYSLGPDNMDYVPAVEELSEILQSLNWVDSRIDLI